MKRRMSYVVGLGNNSKATAVTYTSSESVAIIYLHEETSFVFDTSSVLIQIECFLEKNVF